MKKLLSVFIILLSFYFGNAQNDRVIIMNDILVKEYFEEYVSEALERGYDVQDELIDKIRYIIIISEEFEYGFNVSDLGTTDFKFKLITLNSAVRIDRLILKITLYRELSHVLGVPYNKGSVIMNRRNKIGFSYAAFDDVDIMDIELTKVLKYLD